MNDTVKTPRPERTVPLIEFFGPTVQGEGTMCGFQTYFLRFGLCDYKCTMCDSKHAVNPEEVKKNATYYTPTEIADMVIAKNAGYDCPWMTISGGNPAIHDLSKLVKKLQENGIKVAVETQGTFMPDWLFDVDLITVSPKGPGMGEIINWSQYEHFTDRYIIPAHTRSIKPNVCVKVVVFDEADLDFAKEVLAVHPDVPLYLSLGNRWLPGDPIPGDQQVKNLLQNYKDIAELLYKDKVLNKAIFLPQMHVLVYSNEQAR